MKLSYKIEILEPSTHQALVTIHGKKESYEKKLDFFLPRWSPGSYLIREYSRHLSQLKAETKNGRRLFLEQTDISTFEMSWEKSQTLHGKEVISEDEFSLSYWVYCHELTVRTSHIDSTHAFLHLPTLLMGVLGKELSEPTLEIKFPFSWSKVTTGLKDISTKREVFLYSAHNYDELIDSPIEIGCHETDGFMIGNVPHEVAYYGNLLPHKEKITEDTRKIVEHISTFMGGFPYEKYTFMTHFVPGIYGGLEHTNSTALHYCPTQITQRKGYINYLALVSHEYFHTWNVKRIRPKELGPFNYLREATTKLLWLAEGLTSLMDELFIYRAGLITLEEYLEMQKDNLNRYLNVPGRKFHSLDESSFNAWIKLYRADENTNNSSISYYLKGGIVFFLLNILLVEKKKSINDLLKLLWSDYKAHPERGVTSEMVYKMVEEVAGESVREEFERLTTTTEEPDFESYFKRMGVACDWEKSDSPWLGVDTEMLGDRVVVKSVYLDGPAYKGGLNAGDEILAINSMRVLKDRFNDYAKYLRLNETYAFTITRLGVLQTVSINVGISPQKLKGFKVINQELVEKTLRP